MWEARGEFRGGTEGMGGDIGNWRGGRGCGGGLHKLGGVPPIWRGGWGLTTLREVQGGH